MTHEDFQKAMFYLNHALTPDLHSARLGTICLTECEGYDWRKNASLDLFHQYWIEVQSVYPMTFAKLQLFRSGIFINSLLSLTKPFVPSRIYSRFNLGCCSSQRLDEIFGVGEEANERVLKALDEALERHYHHQTTFSLGD